MINLLPNENKIANKKNYLTRLFVVIGAFSFIIIIISFILFLPVFFSLFFEGRDLASQLDFMKKSDVLAETESIHSDLKELNSKLSLYEKNKSEAVVLSALIEKIVYLKTGGIKINNFEYKKDKNKGGSITIDGKSDSRSSLISFKKKMEDDGAFNNISSPLSNLLKDADITFNITIEL